MHRGINGVSSRNYDAALCTHTFDIEIHKRNQMKSSKEQIKENFFNAHKQPRISSQKLK